MKNLYRSLLLASLVFLSSVKVMAQSCVKIQVSGFKAFKGSLHISVYKDEQTFLKDGKEVITKIVQVNDSSHVDTYFCDLPSGWYAVALYQDLDNNNKMNRGFLGIPSEPYGLSNNIRPRFSVPKFEQCRFYVSGTGKKDVTIALINPN